MSMHLLGLLVGCVWSGMGLVHVPLAAADFPPNGLLSDTILSGPEFYVTGLNNTNTDLTGHTIVLVTNETNGVPLNGPELRVVANTTVYFHITGIWTQEAYYFPVAFGLTGTSSAPAPGQGLAGDAVGLTPTPASVSGGACYSYIDAESANGNGASQLRHVWPNTFGLNYQTNESSPSTGYRNFSKTPCVLQWQVPANATDANTNYYYIEPWIPSTPRRIHIAASDANTPSTGSGSGSGSGSNNNSTTTGTTTAPPTSNGTTAPTGTGSSSPIPTGTGTGTSSTGSKTPSSAFASAHLSGWAGISLVAALAAISTTTAAAAAAL